jgi:hypothetical protein
MVNKTKRDTANRVVITDNSGNRSISAVTSTELSSIDGSTSDSNITMVDADRFVVNNSGTMRQLKASNVFAYLKKKLVGAISTVLTDDLTPGRVVMTNRDGKLYASSVVDSDAIGSITRKVQYGAYYTSGGTRTLDVIENYNGYKVWFEITAEKVFLKIKNTSSLSLTGNGIAATGGDGSSDGVGWYDDIAAGDYTITNISKGQITDSSNTASKAGLAMFSVKGDAGKNIILSYAMHNTDKDEYSVYCKVE